MEWGRLPRSCRLITKIVGSGGELPSSLRPRNSLLGLLVGVKGVGISKGAFQGHDSATVLRGREGKPTVFFFFLGRTPFASHGAC